MIDESYIFDNHVLEFIFFTVRLTGPSDFCSSDISNFNLRQVIVQASVICFLNFC